MNKLRDVIEALYDLKDKVAVTGSINLEVRMIPLSSSVFANITDNSKEVFEMKRRSCFAATIAISLVFLFAAVSGATAATYYIDYQSGSDSNNGISTSTPWKRCPGMVGYTGAYTHSAGDKFVFKGGATWPSTVFPFIVKYSGVQANPDIYTGGQLEGTPWGTGYPVFDGEDTGNFSSGLITNTGVKQYFTINGIKIIRAGDTTDGSGQAMLFLGGSGITVSNCWLEPNGINAFAYATDSGTYAAIYFHHNIIKNAGRVHITAGDARLTDVRYYNNIHYGATTYDPHSYHTDGLMIGGDGTTDYAIQGLYIYNNKWIGDWSKGATAQLYLNGTAMYCYNYTNGSYNPPIGWVVNGQTSGVASKIYTVENSGGWSGSGTGTMCQSAGTLINGENINLDPVYGGQFVAKLSSAAVFSSLKATKNVYIYNNLFTTENTGGSALSPGAIFIAGGHDTVKIYNNTIDARSNTAVQMSHCMDIATAVSNVDIKNNILAGCDNGITLDSAMSMGVVTVDYNLFDTLGGNHLIWDNRVAARYNSCTEIRAAGFGATYCSVSEPIFTARPVGGVVGSGSWSLKANSPAIAAGLSLSPSFTTDITGLTRPGGAWTLGAYEYVPHSSATIGSGTSATIGVGPACTIY